VAGNIITALAACEQGGKPHNYLANLVRPAKALEKKAFEILDLIGLYPLASRLAGSLPYGQKRMLDIGRCLGGSPELILLDEPAAGLNHDEKHILFELLQKLRNNRDLSMMLIEHDVDFVKEICQRMIVLSEGQLIAAGDPASVLADVCVRTAYLGEEVHPC
jgi:branched-chain amino acid transport system ATP-binding protein